MDLSVVGCTSTHWVSVSSRHCTKQQIPWVIKCERLCFMAQTPESRAAEEVRALPLGSSFCSDRGRVAAGTHLEELTWIQSLR